MINFNQRHGLLIRLSHTTPLTPNILSRTNQISRVSENISEQEKNNKQPNTRPCPELLSHLSSERHLSGKLQLEVFDMIHCSLVVFLVKAPSCAQILSCDQNHTFKQLS